MIGRDGLPPAKAIARPPPSSTRRSEAKRPPLLLADRGEQIGRRTKMAVERR